MPSQLKPVTTISLLASFELQKDTMNLKLKRNLPLVLLLVCILSILTFAIGSYPIIAYTL